MIKTEKSEKKTENIVDKMQKAKSRKDKKAKNDLAKLKKKDLLEIMLAQGKEIDRLNAKVSELEEALEQRKIDIENAGSLAEASLKVTDIFKEAEKAASIYLDNVRRKNEQE